MKAYKSLRKDFKKLSKDHNELQKIYEVEVDNSWEESTQISETYETLKIEEDKLHLENIKLSKERNAILQNLQKRKLRLYKKI